MEDRRHSDREETTEEKEQVRHNLHVSLAQIRAGQFLTAEESLAEIEAAEREDL